MDTTHFDVQDTPAGARLFPAGQPSGRLVASVVVGGRPPEIGDQGPGQGLLALDHEGFQGAALAAEGDGEVGGREADVVFVLREGQGRHLRCVGLRQGGDLIGHGKLVPGDDVSLGRPGFILGQGEGNGEVVFGTRPGRQRLQWQLDLLRCAGGHVGTVLPTLLDDPSIFFQLPAHLQEAQIDKGKFVLNAEFSGKGIVCMDLDVLIDLLHLEQGGIGSSIGQHQSVAAEIAVVGFVTVVAPIGPVGLSPLPGPQSLVDPIPDRAALQGRVAFYGVPVVLEIAHAIAHGMGILAEDQGPIGILFGIANQFRDTGIHGTDDVGMRFFAGLFVVDGPGHIAPVNPTTRRLEIDPVTGLIAQGPDDDRGMVLVPLYHPLGSVQVRLLPERLVAQGLVGTVADAVGLDVGLVDHIETILITQLIPAGHIGIVTGTHGVDVVTFHEQDVLHHGGLGEGVAGVRIVLMAIDALDVDRSAVDTELPI